MNHSPCDELYYYNDAIGDRTQCRGVTTWNLENEFTVQPTLMPFGQQNDKATIIFTCTQPRCYSYTNYLEGHGTKNFYGQDAINIHFNAWRNDDREPTGPVTLRYRLNGENAGTVYLSQISTHGATQSQELANINAVTGSLIYDDSGRNTFVFENRSDNTVQLDHVQLYRVYKMCKPPADYEGNCTYDMYSDIIFCQESINMPTTNGYDATRVDWPCNCGGGGLSFTHYQDQRKAGVSISPGSALSWTFNFGTIPASLNPHRNYDGKSICIFNFNNIEAKGNNAPNDVTVQARLNGSLINTYYLSGYADKAISPSHNLAKEPNYHDTLANTIELVNASPVTIRMGEGGGHGVDAYRIYRTTSPLECCGECEVACQVGCEVSCQTACEAACQTGCEISCQTGCEVSCQTGCEVSCQTGCEVSCQTACDTSCQVICEYCQVCYPCHVCYTCMTCQSACELTCQTGCEVSCQTGCEVSCQTGCEVSCQTACDTSCQDCQTCYPCFVCYSWYT